jgi:hypothetical protein
MYIEAPNFSVQVARLPQKDCLFLAGSISNAYDWQNEIRKIRIFENETLESCYHIFNPRRHSFDTAKEEEESIAQIEWEYHAIHFCKNILFWFSNETVAPITLFEYGSALNTHNHNNIFVGCHPEYPRKIDVEQQTKLRTKNITIYDNLKALATHAITIAQGPKI